MANTFNFIPCTVDTDFAGQSGVDDGLSGVDARMHPAASCQSI